MLAAAKMAAEANSLADCKPAPVAESKLPWKNKKDENPMNSYSSATVVTADSIEKDQRRALSRAAYEAFRAKVTAAKKQFGMIGEDAPETMSEFIKRIQDGMFVLPEKYADTYISPYNIQWRDPSVKEDKDGYKAARKELQDAYDKLELRLAIIPVADALKEIEDYRDAK